MANQLRFRSGQVDLHRLRVDSGTVIEAGDLVYLDTDDVKPASSLAWNIDLPTTQGDFAALFLGVAHQQSANGDTDDISVDLSPLSVYEFDANAATYEVGDTLGPDENALTLMDQQLEAAVAAASIARAAEYKAAAASKLRVQFASAFHAGSANTNAVIG
ncbi:MAG: hypothetical protein ACE5KM_10155 [Planctomycetaceae bacterium]